MQIEIENEMIDEREVAATPTREAFTSYSQAALLWKDGEKWPSQFRITMQKGQAPHPKGKYEIMDESFSVNQYGGLELSRYNFAMRQVAETKAKAS